MALVARYDVIEVRKPERTAQGFLRADAVLTRPGVFVYRNQDGTTRREYRPPEEVFHVDSLSSFEDAPITIDHPAEKWVTKENASKLSVGTIKSQPQRDGDLVVARVLVTDAKAIDEVESNRRRSVSCGYTVEYAATPGVTPEGERYDGVQRKIRGNHLALVPAGRAGPEAQIRLDADDAVMVIGQEPTPKPPRILEITTMAKIRLDGVDYEASEQLSQAITVANEKTQKRLDELTTKMAEQAKETEKLKARADASADEAKKAKERADAIEKPEYLRNAVKARVELERKATEILGAEVKLDALDDVGIKRAVVEKIYPAAKEKLAAATPDYIAVRYDAALDAVDVAPNDALAALRIAGGTPVVRNDAEERIAKARVDSAAEWTKPLAVSKDIVAKN